MNLTFYTYDQRWTIAFVICSVAILFSHQHSPANAQVATTSTTPAPVAAKPIGDTENDPPPQWRKKRIHLESQFGEELAEIEHWCGENELNQQQVETQRLNMKRDPLRQYIFPASSKTMPDPALQAGVLGQWVKRINTAKRNHAARIFDLAEEAANAKAGAVAYQLLHEVIYHDRDHQRVRAMLGHKMRDGRWRVATDSLKVRTAGKDHDLFEIKKGTYLQVTTPHFQIDSTVNQQRTIFLAEQLERWHDVWRQVFYEYWASESRPKGLFDGKKDVKPRRKFHVVFLRNRAEYAMHLGRRIPIGDSTGFYSSTERVSIFYDGGAEEQKTWRHELTHQLFRESEQSRKDALEKKYFWIDEGIACYFESLTDFGDYATVGGFDAQRIQFARLRFFLEGYYIDLDEFSKIGRDAFQRRQDIRRLYSQAAGVTDMLMNAGDGKYEKQFIKFLNLAYTKRPRPNSFQKILGTTNSELDQHYREYLKVPTQSVTDFLGKPELQTVLSVANAQLDGPAFKSIGRCVNLTWLDVSGSMITRERLQSLDGCDQLTQIFMTECKYGEDALSGLAVMENLREADLSGSAVSDAHLVSLSKCKSLTSLRLAGTPITDAAIPSLSRIPNLKSIDLGNTRVSRDAKLQLRAARPDITIER